MIYARVTPETKELFHRLKPAGISVSEFAERCFEYALGKGEHPTKFDKDKKKVTKK